MILAALRRSAKDPDTIRVRAAGDWVILDGILDVRHEREMAEHAARSASGVAAVEDHLTISG
ncbi:BON domain-containing protein [Methylorubrum extorquens]